MIEDRVKTVIASVMGVDVKSINDESSPETIAAWDSLKQMNLIMTLEQEFAIEFSEEQVYQLLSYKLIAQTVQEMTQG